MKKSLFLIFCCLVQYSFASSCECPEMTLDQRIKISDYVLVGEILGNVGPDSTLVEEWNSQNGGTTVKVKVRKVLKGKIDRKVIIIDQRGNGTCSRNFQIGNEYLIFGSDSRRLPSTIEMRGQDYLYSDSIFTEGFNLDSVYTAIETYFNNLKQSIQFVHATACSTFSNKSQTFKEVKNKYGW